MMVKTECCSGTCRGCLSTDRSLSPLINYKLYFSLLSEKQKIEVMMESDILMCWECNALMRKMMAFQMQAQEAHTALENFTETATTKTSLSHLTACHNQDYDFIIEETTEGLTNELSDCNFLDTKDVKEEIIDEPIEHKIDEVNVLDMDDSSEHFDANGDDSCIEESDNLSLEQDNAANCANGDDSCIEESENLSLEQDNAANCAIKTKIKVKKLMLPVRERLQRAAKIQKKPIPCKKKRKRKAKKIKSSKKNKGMVRIPIQNAQNPVEKDNKVEEVSGVEIDDEDNQNLDPDVEMESPKATDKSALSDAVIGKNNNVKIEEEVSETDRDDEDSQNSDPDFEIESSKVINKSGQPKRVKGKHKYKLCYKKKEDFESVMCRTERFKYSFCEEDTFFTELMLSEGEIASALGKQPSYKTEELKYECNYCGLCFGLRHTLEKHVRVRHRQLIKSMRCTEPWSPWFYRYRMLRCRVCSAVLRSEHAEAHMKYSHVFRYFCTQCKEVFWDKDQMKAHWSSAHWPYVCDNCDATLTSKWLLVKHMWQHHRASKPFRCEECGARTVSQYNLQKHRERMHSREDSAPELRYCVQCDILFPTILRYQEHLKLTKAHNVKKTYPCSACDKALCSSAGLRQHYSHFHTDTALFPCPHCQKRLCHKSALKEHVNRVHLKIKLPKNKICSICGRAFANNRILRNHVLTHTGERPHACALCPAAFTQKYSLRVHLAAHHKDAPALAHS